MGVSRGIPSGHKMEGLGGLKKGAWSKEEDDVLRQFIEKHGEGKWHQIPPKAGLNRCRKSCRLRWLNHLKPTINKGDFTEDEIDLMLRLHKLLGNRWSLIAGRLPGRTANNVKNYWNARLRKKMNFGIEKLNDESRQTTKSIIVRPRPRTFKRSSHHSVSIAATLEHAQSKNNFSRPFPSSPPIDNGIDWWKAILYDTGSSVERVTCSSSLGLEEDPFTNFWVEDDMKQLQSTRTSVAFDDQEGLMSRSDLFLLSVDLWNISEEERIKMSIERP